MTNARNHLRGFRGLVHAVTSSRRQARRSRLPNRKQVHARAVPSAKADFRLGIRHCRSAKQTAENVVPERPAVAGARSGQTSFMNCNCLHLHTVVTPDRQIVRPGSGYDSEIRLITDKVVKYE